MKLINCIDYIDNLSIRDYEKLDVGIELQDFTDPNLLDEGYQKVVDSYKEMLVGFSKTLSIHGPFLDLKPFSPDRAIRKASIERYKTALRIGRDLDTDYIVFHSQINPWLKERKIRDLNNSMQAEFWKDILKEVDYKGTIVIENVFEDDPVYLRELLDTIGDSRIRVCLDVGHSNIGCKSGLKYWVYELRNYIEYVHIHWNDGKYDQHRYPTDEELKYIFEVFREFKIDPHFALEYGVEDIGKEIKRVIDLTGGRKNE